MKKKFERKSIDQSKSCKNTYKGFINVIKATVGVSTKVAKNLGIVMLRQQSGVGERLKTCQNVRMM